MFIINLQRENSKEKEAFPVDTSYVNKKRDRSFV